MSRKLSPEISERYGLEDQSRRTSKDDRYGETKRNERSFFEESSGVEREREEGTVPAGNGDGVARTPEAEKKRKQGLLEEPSHNPSNNS